MENKFLPTSLFSPQYAKLNVPLDQGEATEKIEYEYRIYIDPTSYTFESAENLSKSFSVTSQVRSRVVNSVSGEGSWGDWTSSNWEIVDCTLGSYEKSGDMVEVSVKENTETSEKSGTLTVRCTGDTSKIAKAELSQKGAIIYEYVFDTQTERIPVSNVNGNFDIDITSYKQSESDSSNQIPVGWSATKNADWIYNITSMSGTGNYTIEFSYGDNTSGSDREGNIVITQSESNKTITVLITQGSGGGEEYCTVANASQYFICLFSDDGNPMPPSNYVNMNPPINGQNVPRISPYSSINFKEEDGLYVWETASSNYIRRELGQSIYVSFVLGGNGDWTRTGQQEILARDTYISY